MKFPSKISLALIVLSILGGHFSASAQKAPVDIQLNGLAAIFGDHVALFTISPAENFSLTEGESHSGIKLLSIDFPARCVRIDDHGTLRTIRICGTPELSAASKAEGKPPGINPDGTPNNALENNSSSTSLRFQTNAAGGVTFAGFVGGGNTANASADKNTGSAGDGASSTESPPVYQWWIQEAKKIENARLETSARVMAGTWPPYPLTPLTPVGTPAQLISADSVFMDHGPGVVLSGN